MPSKKKNSPQATPFLKTAAQAIGTALGKLAVKTGVATVVASPSAASKQRLKNRVATKKKVTLPKKKTAKRSAR